MYLNATTPTLIDVAAWKAAQAPLPAMADGKVTGLPVVYRALGKAGGWVDQGQLE